MGKVKRKKVRPARNRFRKHVGGWTPTANFPFLLLCLFILAGFSVTTSAQKTVDVPNGVVPPPLSVLSKEEKNQLKAIFKTKKRVKLALIFMNARLAKSSEYAESKRYEESLIQLGGFRALLRNTLKFLHSKRKASRGNFKRLEIALRKVMPKLELVRRKMPFKYGYHVNQLMKTVRKARGTAIKPIFGNTVLRQRNK